MFDIKNCLHFNGEIAHNLVLEKLALRLALNYIPSHLSVNGEYILH